MNLLRYASILRYAIKYWRKPARKPPRKPRKKKPELQVCIMVNGQEVFRDSVAMISADAALYGGARTHRFTGDVFVQFATKP